MPVRQGTFSCSNPRLSHLQPNGQPYEVLPGASRGRAHSLQLPRGRGPVAAWPERERLAASACEAKATVLLVRTAGSKRTPICSVILPVHLLGCAREKNGQGTTRQGRTAAARGWLQDRLHELKCTGPGYAMKEHVGLPLPRLSFTPSAKPVVKAPPLPRTRTGWRRAAPAMRTSAGQW